MNITIDKAVMEQALAALEAALSDDQPYIASCGEAVTKLREALTQPVQEPVATVQCIHGVTIGYLEVMQPVGTKLYTSPQAQPLSADRIKEIYESTGGLDFYFNFARAIEQAHGITKGTT